MRNEQPHALAGNGPRTPLDEPLSRSPGGGRSIRKDDVLASISDGGSSALERYRSFFIGRPGWLPALEYEFVTALAGPAPGAVGYLLRKLLFPRLFDRVDRGVNWGRNVLLRHPWKIRVGQGSAFDDHCLLDARGVAGPGEFTIGENVLVASGTQIQAKYDLGSLSIGDGTTIGPGCYLASCGGIKIGRGVGIGSHSFIGGARYRSDNPALAVTKQEQYSGGPVEVGDGAWLGVGVVVLDGVRIGTGAIVGAGAIVREDIPDFTVAMPHPRLVMLPRSVQ